MQIECNKCDFEDEGSYSKLLKRGWNFYFFKERGFKASLCPKCSPTLRDTIKKFFNKKYQTEMYKQIGKGFERIKILYSLKDEEQKSKAKLEKIKKKRKSIKRIRKEGIKNHSRVVGSKSGRISSGRR